MRYALQESQPARGRWEEASSPPASPLAASVQALEASPHVHARWNATRTLGQLGAEAGEEGPAALSRALLHRESEGYLRWQASQSLAELGCAAGQKAGASLAQALLQRKPGQPGADLYVRCGVAGSLGKLGEAAGELGAYALAKALEGERSEYVRRRAAESLGQLGDLVGAEGIRALVRALQRDEDANVRLRSCEALGQIGSKIGEAGVAALAATLGAAGDDSLRIRAAASLGLLGDAAGDAGTEALLRAMRQDQRMVVREQAARSLESLRAVCAKALDDASGATHIFVRGRSARILGLLGPLLGSGDLEILVLALVRESDVYLRRRVVEACEKLGSSVGDLGVAALTRAANEDPDVYVQWLASQAIGGLGLTVQTASAESLARLLERDTIDRPQRSGPVVEEPRQEVSSAPAAETAATEQQPEVTEQDDDGPDSPVSVGSPNHLEMVSPSAAATGGLAEPISLQMTLAPVEESSGPVTGSTAGAMAADGDDAEAVSPEEVPQADEQFGRSRALAVFAKMAVCGEVYSEEPVLVEALRMLGHQYVDLNCLRRVLEQDLQGRSFLDQEDFLTFVSSYERQYWTTLEQHFKEADTDASGCVSAGELTALLKRMGITPATGLVPELLEEVCGSRTGEVNLSDYVKMHVILRERAGFTRAQYVKLRGIFAHHDRDGDGHIDVVQLRSCLLWQGFTLESAEVEDLMRQALGGAGLGERRSPGVPPGPSDGDAGRRLLTEVDFLGIARVVREREAQELLKAVALCDIDHDGTIDFVDPQELPDVLLGLGHAPPVPEVVQEFVRSCGYAEKRELTFEDLCPLLEMIREAEGFSQSELSQIGKVFEAQATDASPGISGIALEHAVRSLGYPATFELVQEILDEYDIDDSGLLDEKEFLQLMGKFRRSEMSTIVQLVRAKAKAMHLSEAFENLVPVEELPDMLEEIGHAPLRKDSDVLKQSAQKGGAKVDMWGIARLVAAYRAEQREEMRKWQGFTEEQVQVFRQKFQLHDPSQAGAIEGKDLGRLLGQLFPEAQRSRAAQRQVVEVLAAADADGSGGIDFAEFLQMMGIVRDYASKERLKKERSAVQDTRFSRSELKEFRQIFRAFDADGSGDMAFGELQQMVAVIVGGVALGDAGARELHDIFASVNDDGSGVLDFPEFLHVMRHLMDRNWRGINDQSQRSAA